MIKKIKLLNKKDAPLLMRVRIGGVDCVVVVDTGANYTVLDRSFAKKYTACEDNEEGSEMIGVGYSDTFDSSDFCCMMEVLDSDGSWNAMLLEGIAVDLNDLKQACKELTDLPVVGIVGTMWLDYWKAKIDVRKKTMTLE
jgi:hypothetical protein